MTIKVFSPIGNTLIRIGTARNIVSYAFPAHFKPLPIRALDHGNRTAVFDALGKHTYEDILKRSIALSLQLKVKLKARDKQISILLPNDHRYVVCQWASWLNKLCTVPLHPELPEAQLQYYIQDSASKLIIVSECLREKISKLIPEDHVVSIPQQMAQADDVDSYFSNGDALKLALRKQNAQIVYTSGTTGSPKGVVTSQRQLHVQMAAVANAWRLNEDDTILHHLPLHHTHGIVNALWAPLLAGSRIHMIPKFSPKHVWDVLLDEESTINILMGVPTMYAKLISFANEHFGDHRSKIRDYLRIKLRLCTCGSAPLPDSILKAWQELSGHTLLERYGMSEFGMGLGNPLDEADRKAGHVGKPFPGIVVRLATLDAYSQTGYQTLAIGDMYSVKCEKSNEGTPAELLVKGPQVFSQYFNRPEETKKAFTKDGWFITGDIAAFEKGAFKILGRSSTDIIKSGGYKISALEIERVLLEYEGIQEASVFGVPDLLWGERVVAVIVSSKIVTNEQIREHCLKCLPKHSIPTETIFTDAIPRNALGKVNKSELRKKMFPSLTTTFAKYGTR